jgi:hypothetical protein
MGTEAAPILFGIPFAVCLTVLLVFVLRERRRSEHAERVLGLGRGRLAAGYFGALCVLLAWCIVASLLDGEPQVAALYFIVFGLLLIVMLTVIVLPIFALLRKFGWLSLLGIVCVGIVLSVTLGILFGGVVVPSALVGGTMSAAFSVAARLPLVRSGRMSANKPLHATCENARA